MLARHILTSGDRCPLTPKLSPESTKIAESACQCQAGFFVEAVSSKFISASIDLHLSSCPARRALQASRQSSASSLCSPLKKASESPCFIALIVL